MGASSDPIDVRELRGVKFSMDVKNPQAMTSGADQDVLISYSDGTKGLATTGAMENLVLLVNDIRATLIANGMMKGSV